MEVSVTDSPVNDHCTRRQFLALLSEADADQSLAHSTKSAYRSGLSSFLKFCIREKRPAVPTIDNICSYISASCRTASQRTHRPLAPGSIQGYLSAIAASFEHLYPDVRLATNLARVRKVLRGVRIQFSLPVTRKDPLTIHDLILVSDSSSLDFDDTLFTALLLVGFHGLHRLGEITSPDSDRSRSHRKIILRASLSFSNCGGFAKYTLPHSKTDPFFQGSSVILAACAIPGACPITALSRYVLRRDVWFDQSGPLFMTLGGVPPTRSWFLARFRRYFEVNKSGHSMRSGGATAFAQAGLPLDHIQDIGRWSSEAFKTYVRDHPIMRLAATRAHPLSLDSHVGSQVVFG